MSTLSNVTEPPTHATMGSEAEPKLACEDTTTVEIQEAAGAVDVHEQPVSIDPQAENLSSPLDSPTPGAGSLLTTDTASLFDNASLGGTETDATSPSDGGSQCGLGDKSLKRSPPIPDRNLCKKSMSQTPNCYVWAHRMEDLVLLGAEHDEPEDQKYWSPSMVRVGEQIRLDQRTKAAAEGGGDHEESSFRERLYGKDWDGSVEDEPAPRKLKVWPVLTMKDWSPDACPEELRGIVDACVSLTSPPTIDGDSDAPHVAPQLDDELQAIAEQTTLFRIFEPPSSIPKLEQPIPDHLLPDVLMITDPTSRSGRNRGDRQPTAEKYRRVYPPPNTTNSMPSTAQLRFIHSSFVGQGSHSAVYPAELTLDDRFTMLDPESPASAPTRTWGPAVVQVVVKVTDSYLEDRKMLENEAAMYTAMRKRWPVLSEHWSGFNAISEARHPTDDDVGFDVRVPATAVVPQFYGYYVPVDSTSRSRPLMLLENCGVQITPRQLSQRDKMTCHTLIHRLWFAGVAQGSVYERNFVVQRGPLTHPPHLRSRLDNSSFRIIDFGRGEWIEEVQRELDWGKMTGEQRRISKLVYASARDALYGGTRRRKYYEENY